MVQNFGREEFEEEREEGTDMIRGFISGSGREISISFVDEGIARTPPFSFSFSFRRSSGAPPPTSLSSAMVATGLQPFSSAPISSLACLYISLRFVACPLGEGREEEERKEARDQVRRAGTFRQRDQASHALVLLRQVSLRIGWLSRTGNSLSLAGPCRIKLHIRELISAAHVGLLLHRDRLRSVQQIRRSRNSTGMPHGN